MDLTNHRDAIEGVHYYRIGERVFPIVAGGDGPVGAVTDTRNLPPEVLARLAEHADLEAAVSVVQRGRVHEGRSFQRAEMRTDDDGNPEFEGYATVYDHPYQVGGTYGWEETIGAGACDKSVSERDDVRLLVNHDGIPLARTKSGTLTLNSDTTGLFCASPLDKASPLVATVVSAMNRGTAGMAARDLDEMSFAMRVIRQQWNGDYTERLILELRLVDVSIVTYPANPAATALLRSLHPSPALSNPLSLALVADEQLLLRRR